MKFLMKNDFIQSGCRGSFPSSERWSDATDMVTKIEPMTMKKRMLILKQRKLHLIYSITNHLQ